jgi:hypothetical protein
MFFAPFRLQGTNRNWIGRSQNGTQPYFNGRIDDFRIYRGALGPDDLVAMMNDQQRYVDMGAGVRLTQVGAVLNRTTQKYVGGVTITNTGGPVLSGAFLLKLAGLGTAVTLDNASGMDAGVPYVIVNANLPPGATLSVPLTFSNPTRGLISYTPGLYKSAF